MEIKNYFAQDGAGNLIAAATCSLYLKNTQTLATVYDKNGIQTTNPFYSDGTGLIQFAAAAGLYDLKVTANGRTYTIVVQCVDIAEQVAEVNASKDQAAASATAASGSAASAATSASVSESHSLAASSSAVMAAASEAGALAAKLDAQAAATYVTVSADEALASKVAAESAAAAALASEQNAAADAAQVAADKVEIRNWYYGPLPADPTTRPDGTAMQVGDEYHNTGTNARMVFNGTVWIDFIVGLRTDLANATDPEKGAGMVGHKGGSVAARLDAAGSDLGDLSVDGALVIMCGDSTTEQWNGADSGSDRITNTHRVPGGAWNRVAGLINFGGSGYRLDGFVNDPQGALPIIPTDGNKGTSSWDYYGHKPTGAISLATALAWRSGKADRALWVLCYGINDCILNAAVGTLPQAEIAAYVAQRLRTAVNRIISAYPRDGIILRVPNPMTARPYSATAGFPSATQYPAFGQDAAADQALVEKWNQALRAGYLAVRGEFPKTVLLDTWDRVFGKSSTSLLAATQLPYLGDLVHPNGSGYVGIADELVAITTGRRSLESPRVDEAERRAALIGGNAWDNNPGYFMDKPGYKRVLRSRLIAKGANYLDLSGSYAEFMRLTGGRAIYLAFGSEAAQAFATYAATDHGGAGATIRFISVAPSAAVQALTNGVRVEVYIVDEAGLVAGDIYVHTQAATAKEWYDGTVISGGNGYIDFRFSAGKDRVSSKYLDGLKSGTLTVGGGINGSIALSGATINRNGESSARVVRILVAGDYSVYAGKPAAIHFADAAPSPKVYEAVFTQRGVVPHAQNARGFVHCPARMEDGATLSAFLTEQIPQEITVQVYRARWATRALIGTITIAANASGGTLASGNPTLVEAGTIYEFVVTSATSQATGLVGLAVTPV